MTGPLDGARARVAAAVGPGGRLGVQVYVSLRGRPVWHEAFGEFLADEPLTVEHRMPWMCAGKPLTVIALARLFDRGRLVTGMRVGDVIPEFATGGKQDVTLDHLLTHTVVYESGGEPPWGLDRAAALRHVCRATIAAPPGERAAYEAMSSWLVLSEVIQRVTGRDYHDVIREDVLDELGMSRTVAFLGPGFDRDDVPVPEGALSERTAEGELRTQISFPDEERWPGTEMWGPVAELARPLEAIAAGGVWNGTRLLSEQAVEHFCAPLRVGLADEYFQGLDLSWSRGFCTEPGWFGAPSGARIVGHTGYVTVLSVADLDRGLVIAFVANTTVREPLLRGLANLLVTDVYQALAGQ
ncbi:beta-lactamase family protein [Nonomuraea sp. NN258]|uniref:serine hydrolase domain-containing protein n=1 Tax=Nonomuraea antri TaxID=2730852 RepID=UPI00156A5B56|nr:serine hydrolase domain-containing protein [Nonomuraea antri]NRQ33078.1 beta-lactamase family protein [Nonomuraea antri]